jgi:DNA-binding CsgD family transcriptional regulator
VAWGIHESQRVITESQRTMLRLLAPHFRRAISIAKLLDMKALAADTFESALDGFSIAILLVDEDLDVVHANAAARTLLSDQDPVRAQGGRLALPHPQSTSALAEAVRRAALGGLELGQRGIGIPTRRRDGSPAVVHVMPLRSTARASGVPQRAVAVVFVATALSPPQMPAAALALLHDLTPAETRVLELIVEGRMPSEIAAQLGVSVNTTKTHLQRVFDKTGTSRQAELVRLVGSLSLPV